MRIREAERERRRREAPSGWASPTTAPEDAPLVSVIVVCWNAEDVLGRCLSHLLEQDHPNYEVIVVDDGSRDGSVAVAEAAAARGALKVVRSARNRGCASARNLGLEHANGEIVAFVDADGFAAPDWLRGIVAAFGSDLTIGGVASTVFYDDNPLVLNGAGGTVNRQGWAADLTMNESYERAEIAVEALYPMGCGMAFRREVLQRFGPFDDRMLNYYDDVDYGTGVWRSGYRVLVAPDAWVDHGAVGIDSPRKRLLCERHRMRVVLKHASTAALGTWVMNELRSLRAASSHVRKRKLAAIAWNVRHMTSVLAFRRRLRGVRAVPSRLVYPSWGDAFPIGIAPRTHPRPEFAGNGIDVAEADADAQLPYGWFPLERIAGRGCRWAGERATALVLLQKPAIRMRIDYSHVPVDTGGVDVCIRRIDSPDPLMPVWSTHLSWQFIARSVENHRLELPAGDYEVLFSAAHGWSDPPAETRTLAFALTSLSFTARHEIPAGGLEMAARTVEEQLGSGWFEAEETPTRSYRWAAASATAVVRLTAPARSVKISYALPPGARSGVRVAVAPVGGSRRPLWSGRLADRGDGWHEDSFELQLAPGEYLMRFDSESTWSNPDGRDAGLWPENRSLGFALSSLSFG